MNIKNHESGLTRQTPLLLQCSACCGCVSCLSKFQFSIKVYSFECFSVFSVDMSKDTFQRNLGFIKRKSSNIFFGVKQIKVGEKLQTVYIIIFKNNTQEIQRKYCNFGDLQETLSTEVCNKDQCLNYKQRGKIKPLNIN